MLAAIQGALVDAHDTGLPRRHAPAVDQVRTAGAERNDPDQDLSIQIGGRSFVYTDKTQSCADCGQQFVFTAGEQEFYAQRGFTEAPKRCASCRAQRKAQRSASGGYAQSGGGAASYGDSGNYSSRGSYGGGSSYGESSGYSERRPREMFEAVCAECGKVAQVPFQPTGARPVYCSDCFQSRRG